MKGLGQFPYAPGMNAQIIQSDELLLSASGFGPRPFYLRRILTISVEPLELEAT
jgi:hypothetical protein